jgi:hypothetical protein
MPGAKHTLFFFWLILIAGGLAISSWINRRRPNLEENVFALIFLLGVYLDEETGELRERLQRIEGVLKGQARRALAPEVQRTYNDASDHWRNCPLCSAAGGERAAPGARCSAGKMLVEVWEATEREFRQL